MMMMAMMMMIMMMMMMMADEEEGTADDDHMASNTILWVILAMAIWLWFLYNPAVIEVKSDWQARDT